MKAIVIYTFSILIFCSCYFHIESAAVSRDDEVTVPSFVIEQKHVQNSQLPFGFLKQAASQNSEPALNGNPEVSGNENSEVAENTDPNTGIGQTDSSSLISFLVSILPDILRLIYSFMVYDFNGMVNNVANILGKLGQYLA